MSITQWHEQFRWNRWLIRASWKWIVSRLGEVGNQENLQFPACESECLRSPFFQSAETPKNRPFELILVPFCYGQWSNVGRVFSMWQMAMLFIQNSSMVRWHIVSKTYMTRVEGENTRLRHYLAPLHRKTLCYSKSIEMIKCSHRLLLHYLRFKTVPIPA